MTAPRQIMVAMHDREMAAQLTALLEKAKYPTQRCATARELIEALETDRPTMILLGVLLPDGNGPELCKRIKSSPNTDFIKVIVVSAFKRSARFGLDVRTKFLADEYVEMPVAPHDFLDLIEAVASGRVTGSRGEAERRAPKPARPDPAPAAPPPERPARGEGPAPRPPERKPAAERPRPAAPGPPLSGRLGPVLLPELLLALFQRHATGVLEVRSFDEQREILIRDGAPAAIRSNFIPDEALGQLLLAQGLIDQVALEKALARAKEEGRKIGQILVEAQLIPRHDLQAMLRAQAKRKMNSAFRWKEGVYTFTPGAREMTEAVEIEQDLLSILIAGVARHYDMAKLEERLYGNKEAVVSRARKPEIQPRDLGVSEQERLVLDLVDGERTLGDIIAEAELSFIRSFQVLYLLLLFGVIHFRDGDRFFRLDDAVANRARAQNAAGRGAAAEVKAATLPNEGDLAETPLARFLLHLYRSKATGRLTIAHAEEEESIYLAEGLPVQVLSARPGPHALGRILERKNQLDPAARDAALERAREAGRPLGETLLAEGLLSPHDLFEALLAQLENKLIALFEWPDGRYRFEEGIKPPLEAPPMNFDLARLIARGLQRGTPPTQAAEQLRDRLNAAPTWAGSALDAVKMFAEPRESRVLALIDGEATVQQIVERSPLPEGRTAQILAALWQLGFIRFAD